MDSITLVLQIYGMGIIIAFLLAAMIKILLITIRLFSRDNSEEVEHVEQKVRIE